MIYYLNPDNRLVVYFQHDVRRLQEEKVSCHERVLGLVFTNLRYFHDKVFVFLFIIWKIGRSSPWPNKHEPGVYVTRPFDLERLTVFYPFWSSLDNQIIGCSRLYNNASTYMDEIAVRVENQSLNISLFSEQNLRRYFYFENYIFHPDSFVESYKGLSYNEHAENFENSIAPRMRYVKTVLG